MVGQFGRVFFAAQRRVEALLEGQAGPAVQRDGDAGAAAGGLGCADALDG